jgi:hypothetical protein
VRSGISKQCVDLHGNPAIRKRFPELPDVNWLCCTKVLDTKRRDGFTILKLAFIRVESWEAPPAMLRCPAAIKFAQGSKPAGHQGKGHPLSVKFSLLHRELIQVGIKWSDWG